MSFVEIIKRQFGGVRIPNDILRVNHRTIALSSNIGERFQGQRTTLTTGREKVSLGIAYDTETKQIRLVPNSVNGFSFTTGSSGISTLSVAMPKILKNLVQEGQIPIGDYVLTDDKNLIFTLAE